MTADTAPKTESDRRPCPISSSDCEIVTAATIDRQNARLRHRVGADSVVTKVATLLEPPKHLMIPYLDIEHGDILYADERFAIPRRAEVQYCLKGQPRMWDWVDWQAA